ncbi:TyrR family helix-turn-helix protein [Salsuginibacillus halophilus]|uniref:HTH-type transcriptional regulatory protein TyrR n=1 Tax=Salsuginibacillus halophilus TaxID=517424 RepID=A0A2P8H9S9_9BACI|nr:sigma 54-interacting transcriptional regulator [Salsuginibacillus halophilus]PSL42940.1 TyrR family helix-turn-helix protein [Salsuginibacillus halophilus]
MNDLFDTSAFQAILNVIDDGLFFSTNDGEVLWLNQASEKILNADKAEIIGMNVYDLEEQGLLNPSVSRRVIESQSTVSTVQSSSGGNNYLVTGYFLEVEEKELIVVQSRDITKALETSEELEETQHLLRRYSQEIRSMQFAASSEQDDALVGQGPVFQRLLHLMRQAASVNTTVLVTGETGVGKNVIAERVHNMSERKEEPFIHINCSAIPESLIESELFGYVKGAFTGAHTGGKNGLVQMADRGTLFLDEISELPLHLQPKLLQLLQSKTFLPVGATALEKVDTRIIAATNKDLYQMVTEGKFREDLYYRLNILSLDLPPLRERKEDLLLLLQKKISYFNHIHRQNRSFSQKALEILQDYRWPGNIRELENVVERLVITARDDEITSDDLPETIRYAIHAGSSLTIDQNLTLPEAVEDVEKQLVKQAYQNHQTTRKAAAALGVSQSAFMRRLQKYGVTADREKF